MVSNDETPHVHVSYDIFVEGGSVKAESPEAAIERFLRGRLEVSAHRPTDDPDEPDEEATVVVSAASWAVWE